MAVGLERKFVHRYAAIVIVVAEREIHGRELTQFAKKAEEVREA